MKTWEFLNPENTRFHGPVPEGTKENLWADIDWQSAIAVGGVIMVRFHAGRGVTLAPNAGALGLSATRTSIPAKYPDYPGAPCTWVWLLAEKVELVALAARAASADARTVALSDVARFLPVCA